ncbi:MAG: substrate-binding domain-containing protein [Nitrospirota bacterium]|nr:MAG: substrate-binding domain-containing protein [Nitrospirota bacterium]
MRYLKTGLFIITAAVFLALPTAYAAEEITICGTGDSQALLRMLAASYEEEHPGSKINVPDSIGSKGGIKATAKGDCELGRVARPIKDSEMKYGLEYKVFAFSPVVFAVNKSVKKIPGLSGIQVLNIFSGRTTNWKELGGPDMMIKVINREPGDSSRSVLMKNLPGFEKIKDPVGIVIEHNTPLTIETISTNKGAIGYIPLSSVDRAHMRILKLDGVAPTKYRVWRQEYKPVSPLGIIWKGELQGLAKSFFDYLFTSEVQARISRVGLIPAKLDQ